MTKNFDEIIERLKQVKKLKSDADVARHLKIEIGTFSYMRKKQNIPAEAIIEALKGTDLNFEWIFYGLGTPTIEPKLKLGGDAPLGEIAIRHYPDISASAGYGCLNGDHCEFETIHVDRALLSRASSKNIEAINVSGDSMSPTMNNGDMIFVDKSQHEIRNGKVFIVKMNDEVFVKRIFIAPRGLIVKSDNPDYPQFDVKKEELQILGQVIYTMEYHG